jgi:hypothetical protein
LEHATPIIPLANVRHDRYVVFTEQHNGDRTMSTYEFGGSLYSNRAQVVNAIAGEWLTAGGANHADDIRDALERQSDAEMAGECIDGWRLNEAPESWPSDDEAQSAMERDDWTAEDLAAAFAQLRARVAAGEEV